LPVGGGFDSLVSHAMHVERVRHALQGDLDHEHTLRQHGGEIAKDLERVAKDRDALASQRTSMDAARLAMEDEVRRQAAFEKAFESSHGGNDYVAVYGGSQTKDMVEPSSPTGFAALRGRLLFPVSGRAEVRPARREGADGPGVEIVASAGTGVRAVFAGRVAFTDRYGAYGRIVILDHGEHYYTVSGNLGAVDVKVGDEVSAGERVGTVGDDGQGAVLYFEIRHGSQTVAPGPWLGL
jgi:septal ring factor EnvC (AmiA/AmiB activator)